MCNERLSTTHEGREHLAEYDELIKNREDFLRHKARGDNMVLEKTRHNSESCSVSNEAKCEPAKSMKNRKKPKSNDRKKDIRQKIRDRELQEHILYMVG